MSSRAMKVPLLLGALALLLAGCIRDTRIDDDPAAQATATAEVRQEVVDALSLAGTSWQLEFIGEPSDDMPVLPGTRATVNYALERYGGTGGCNFYLGVYTADTSTLRMNTPATTMSGCEPEGVMLQEGTFMSALVNTTEYQMEGEKLVMYTVGEQRMLTFVPAEPVPFEGTTWVLRFVWSDRFWVPTIPGSETTAVFQGDQMSGSGGCNSYSATVEIAGGSMTIGPAASTMMACAEPEGVMDQESAYFTALASVTGFEQLGGLLTLLDAEGNAILAFSAAAE